MTDKTLTTTQTREYIRQRRGLDRTPSKSTINYYQTLGYITPHTQGGTDNSLQNTYLVADLDLLCDRLDNGYYRKIGQASRPPGPRNISIG